MRYAVPPVDRGGVGGSPVDGVTTFSGVVYQHPLAYLLGIEGVALLRAWGGDHDREFVQARLAEVRATR
jgi:hypothetical protein